MKLRVLGAAAAVLLMLGAAGCGSNNDDTARKSLSKDLSASKDGKISLTKKQSDCVAGKMVDKPGVKKLQKAGILGKDYKVKDKVGEVKMGKSDADATADAIVKCADAKKIFFDALGASSSQIPPQVKTCLEGKLSEDDIHDVLSAVFQGDTSNATSGIAKKASSCMTGATQ